MKKFLAFIAVLCLIGGVGCLVYAGTQGYLDDFAAFSTFGNNLSTEDRAIDYYIDELDEQVLTVSIDVKDCAVLVEYQDITQYTEEVENATQSLSKVNSPETLGKFEIDGTGNTLTITQTENINDGFNWQQRFAPTQNYVVVTLSDTLVGKVSLEVVGKTGYAKVSGSYEDVSIEVTTGAILLKDVTATSVVAKTNTGAIVVEGINAVTFNANTSTGAVVASEVTANSVTVKTQTGAVIVEELRDCEQLEVAVNTGSINVTMYGAKSDYNITVDKHTGGSNLSSNSNTDSTKTITVSSNTGSIHFKFKVA